MGHDPIATPAVALADNREPVFRHPAQEAEAQRRIADYASRHGGRRPNVLIVLMDDVGWGDFGCYGGGVAVGAPTPHIDRLAALRETGQLEHTLIFVSSDNGPEMETWPDAAYSPFRCAKGSTWEGGQRVPGILAWQGMIDPGRASDGLFSQMDVFATALALAGASASMPEDRYIDGVDQASFLLCDDGHSNRKYIYYWLGRQFSALRVGEYKFMLASISDDDRDVHNPGGFTGVTQKYPYGRLYNLYLDPKETRSYLIRKLAYLEAFQTGVKNHMMSYAKYKPKVVVGL